MNGKNDKIILLVVLWTVVATLVGLVPDEINYLFLEFAVVAVIMFPIALGGFICSLKSKQPSYIILTGWFLLVTIGYMFFLFQMGMETMWTYMGKYEILKGLHYSIQGSIPATAV